MPSGGPWSENALIMVHFLGTPAYSEPYRQATKNERRLVLHFYASQGHRVPRPPPNFSALAHEVAKQVAASMDPQTTGEQTVTHANFYSVPHALSATFSSELPTRAASSSSDPPDYEQATLDRAIHESSLQHHKPPLSPKLPNANEDICEMYEPWTAEQLAMIEETRVQEIRRVQRLHQSSSAVIDSDTSAADRELRRRFSDLYSRSQTLRPRCFSELGRVDDEVQRVDNPWKGNDPKTDGLMDVEEVTARMVTCTVRSPSKTSIQTVPAVVMPAPSDLLWSLGATEHTPIPSSPLQRPDNLRRPQDLPLRDRGYDYHLLADLFNYDWHVDSADFEHREGNLGPD